MLATELRGMVGSSKMTDFSLWRTMSGPAVVVLSSTGIVAGGDSQARWLGMSAKTAAVGLCLLMKGSSFISTWSWHQVYRPSDTEGGQLLSTWWAVHVLDSHRGHFFDRENLHLARVLGYGKHYNCIVLF